MKTVLARSALALVFILATAAGVAGEKPYTEGSVIQITSIRTRPGMFDAYMKWVATERKKEMEEFKKQGLILSYNVYTMNPHSPQDPDIILIEEYRNSAAFDGLQDREDAIDAKLSGSLDAANKAAIDREKLREVLGTEYMRELKLK